MGDEVARATCSTSIVGDYACAVCASPSTWIGHRRLTVGPSALQLGRSQCSAHRCWAPRRGPDRHPSCQEENPGGFSSRRAHAPALARRRTDHRLGLRSSPAMSHESLSSGRAWELATTFRLGMSRRQRCWWRSRHRSRREQAVQCAGAGFRDRDGIAADPTGHGRSHNEAPAGRTVALTASSSSVLSLVMSTSSRSLVENVAMICSASYLLR